MAGDRSRSGALVESTQAEPLDASAVARQLRQLFDGAQRRQDFFEGLLSFLGTQDASIATAQVTRQTTGIAGGLEACMQTMHELRSLLSAVTSNVEVAILASGDLFNADTPPSIEQNAALCELKECLADASTAADQAVVVAKDPLKLLQQQCIEGADLSATIDLATRMARRCWPSDVAFSVENVAGAQVAAPAAELFQVLLSLLRDVRSAKTGPDIRIRVRVDQEQAYVSIFGQGSPASPSRQPVASSVSLCHFNEAEANLQVCNRIVGNWPATIEVTPADNGGTETLLTIPLGGS